jgi:uncharacterized protein (DUF427 family)
MSLTAGRGPFGRSSRGRFDFDAPEHVVYVEDFPRRVRAVVAGRVVVDSDDVVLVHETAALPHYAFPAGTVHVESEDEPHVDGYVQVPWASVDAWYEEDERVEVHPRDPYHRVDAFLTSRRVRVTVDGTTLADSTRTRALYETGLPVRFYVPSADVTLDLLEPSATRTECPYKGTARHWSARLAGGLIEDVAWQYDREVRREAEPVRGMYAFYDDRVDIEVDGAALEQ